MTLRRTLLPLGATGAATAILALGVTPIASAHVGVTPDDTAAGAYTVLTFSVPHGCDGSPTTKVAIQMPEEIPSVTPTRNPFYSVEKVMETLDEPITDAHGNEITERVSQVVYTAQTPLPDGERDTLELSVQLPDAAGETLAFPVIQSCTKGETAWTEVAEDGGSEEELEHPAPTVSVTEATEDGHGHGTAEEASTETESDTDADAAEDGDSDGNGLAIAGLVAGVLGIVVGGVALARSGSKG
ncbi:YcnI family copper-binding membrane protein [Nocardioides sambongensis]|uniref:YcnI family copper-binding membrane protein n=1 Tax=Nocardioides sambongensis TaxID=2589074 RepID=UPI001125CC17|nr:YcnI family protein [Nocardioides sambongensis]